MPEMNGISLLEKVKANWPKCKVILLTAHARFDYAFEAIKNNAAGYILKTEDDVKILSVINKAIEQLETEYKDLKMLMEARKKFNESLSLIRKEFLHSVLMGEYTATENLSEHFKKLRINFDPKCLFFLVIGKVEPFPVEIDKLKEYDLMLSVEHIAQQNLQQYTISYPVRYEQRKIAWVMQLTSVKNSPDQKNVTSHGSQDNINTFIKGSMEITQKMCRETMGVSISFVLSSTQMDWKNISERFNRMEQILGYMGGIEEDFIITDTAFIENTLKKKPSLVSESPGSLVRPGSIEKLRAGLENGDKESFILALRDIFSVVAEIKSKNSNQVLELYYSVAIILLSFINRKGLAESIAFRIGLHKLMRADLHDSWKDAADYIFRLTDIVFELQYNEKKQIINNLANFINDFIDMNISGDLSLIRLSEETANGF